MPIQISAFRWVPHFAQGYVKDLRVRWALEEAELPYEVVLIDPTVQASASYRQWQPFGQVPAYRDGDVELFESGAILLHLASKSERLAPLDPAGQARTATWVLAALNSVEPFVQVANHFARTCTEDGRVRIETMLATRLRDLSTWLDGKELLDGRFTVGDLVMTTVLRELVEDGTLSRYPVLDAYRQRCEARPAFGRALEAQLTTFRENAPLARQTVPA